MSVARGFDIVSIRQCILQHEPVRARTTHFPEHSTGLLHEVLGRVELEDLPAPKNEDPIVVEHSFESVRDGDDDGTRELLAHRALDLEYASTNTNQIREQCVPLEGRTTKKIDITHLVIKL